MKFLVVLSAFLAVSFAQYCYNDVVGSCGPRGVELKNCHAKYGAVDAVLFDLQSYVNAHISRSFDYLLMSTHFGNYEQSREGFEKLFRKLSDSTWDDAIDLIKYIAKRGGAMDFAARKPEEEPQDNAVELYELGALARGLDTQKKLAEEAFTIHSGATRRREGYHDPEVSSYLEEHFMHRQAESVRELAGYTSDLKRLLSENKQASLSLFLFDEYLQKVV
uniref:Ferritin n=1 Tax=Coptotermes formosanus TaxID=36987 RepID=R4UMS8_COPFO|nr:ferritin, heavy subunit [Coptotermes formosanus]AGM32405.1 ferritin, heavy subunit [Coptotermes formosanus]